MSTPTQVAAEHFGTLGETYRFLLQLPPESRIGLIGRHWVPYLDNFVASGLRAEALTSDSPTHAFDALFFDGTLRNLAALVRKGLDPVKRLLVLVRQRHLPAGVVRGASSLATQSLAQPTVADFTPIPDFDHAEAFIAPEVDPSPWMMKRSLLRSLLPRWQRRPTTHLLVIAPSLAETGFGKASDLLTRATGDTGFWVERFHPRKWGPLILVLVNHDGDRRVIRIATNPRVVKRITQNQQCTSQLIANPALPPHLARLIPTPLGTAVDSDSTEAFAEEFRGGVLAWTLYRDAGLRERIDASLLEFTHGMQLATRRTPQDPHAPLDELVGTMFPHRSIRAEAEPAVQRLYDDAERTVRARFQERPLPRCLGHGDYGVGNALATKAGTLTGIFDWDQHVDGDLPGMDWCAHRLRAEHWRRGVTDALEELLEGIRTSGYLAPEGKAFGEEDFCLSRPDLKLIACLAAFRSLSRSGKFISQLRSAAPQARTAVEKLARTIAAAAIE